MTCSGEVIDLILRDESIHGLYVGVLAQEVFRDLDAVEQKEVTAELYVLLNQLHANEEAYTEELYSGLSSMIFSLKRAMATLEPFMWSL